MVLTRKAATHFFAVASRRHLGNAVRGPPTFLNDIPAHAALARKAFCPRIATYDALKQRYESLRVFVFWGATGALAADLLVHPPSSEGLYSQWIARARAALKSNTNFYAAASTKGHDVLLATTRSRNDSN